MTMLMGRLTGVALELALAALLVLFLPPYYVYRLTASFLGSVFPDSVSGKVVLITGASSGIGEVCIRYITAYVSPGQMLHLFYTVDLSSFLFVCVAPGV